MGEAPNWVRDKRSVKILFDTYWSSNGWKEAGHLDWSPETPPEDLEYATRQGMMFPARRVDHADLQERLFALRDTISPVRIGSAFAATLSSGLPALRSALGSYAVTLTMPGHGYESIRVSERCNTCGTYECDGEQDVNVLNFERWKWGGVRHEDPFYAAFDLERFRLEPSPPPSEADIEALNALLDCAGSMLSGAKPSDLAAAIKRSFRAISPSGARSSAFSDSRVSCGFPDARASSASSRPPHTASRPPGTKTTGPIPFGGGAAGAVWTPKRYPSGSVRIP